MRFTVRIWGWLRQEVRRREDKIDTKLSKTFGNPERVLSYTVESFRKISDELNKQGIKVGYVTVGEILESMGYSNKQSNQKMLQVGEPHPDRYV